MDVTGSGTGSFVTTIKSSVALAGSPTTTTQTAGDNSTKIATTAYVNSAVAAGSGPAYTSSQQTITASSVITLAHGLAAAPSFVTVGLVCVTANLNYAVGDVIALPYAFYFNGAGTTNTNVGYQIAYNATDIFITTSSAMIVCNKTTGTLSNITYADWKYVVKAWN